MSGFLTEIKCFSHKLNLGIECSRSTIFLNARSIFHLSIPMLTLKLSNLLNITCAFDNCHVNNGVITPNVQMKNLSCTKKYSRSSYQKCVQIGGTILLN